MYNTIPKSREWMSINCVVNAKGITHLGFYIFRGDYIQLYKLGTYMAMQSKA
jgi:hypothetical protein